MFGSGGRMGMAGMGAGMGGGRMQAALAGDDDGGTVFSYRVVARLAPYVRPSAHLVAIATVAMIVFAASLVAVPWLIKVAVDDYIVPGDLGGLGFIVALFVGNALMSVAAHFTQEIAMTRAGQGVLYRLREDMFAHLQKLSLKFYDRTEVGRLMSRVLGDVYQLQEFLSVAVITIGDLLSLILIVVAVVTMSLKLGLISMVLVPVLVLIVMVWQPFAKRGFVEVRRTISIVNGALNENISGVRVVQSMNRQERNLEQFDEKNRASLTTSLSATRLATGLLMPVDTLTHLGIGLVIYFGARMVTDDAIEVGTMVAFVLYIQRFFEPIRSLTMQYTQLQRAMASGARIFELLDAEPDVVDAPGARDLPRLEGEIEVRGVSYGYVEGEDVLKNVNIHVKPGSAVAIVGPTGAGKTTLVSLIARFYDVEQGRGAILVDGKDIRDVKRGSLARQMSMVLQEPFLFSATVRENIKYNHPDVTDEQMIEATKAVGAHDFITQLEDGYDTDLHERGVNLSVGQRQLVSFARAIVADPRVLILDEATANIDSYTEMLVQRALKRLLEGRTAIVIAHRLSTIRGADQIVVLHLGEVVEVGTHDELMQNGNLYAHLYQMNFASLKSALADSPDDPPG